ncbi:MAG TPA: hypothetical protein VJ323_09540 [Bryobacteraceae bacterium]|jgi:hypothetical protein|nr:hypothetical protein [Bryobacteraceae bacterium]
MALDLQVAIANFINQKKVMENLQNQREDWKAQRTAAIAGLATIDPQIDEARAQFLLAKQALKDAMDAI